MRSRDPVELFVQARAGDRGSLARLLSTVERGGSDAATVRRLAFGSPDEAYTVGLTGAPGAGKSTLTDRLITALRTRGETVAVVAVDPSSPKTGGAFLGDRARMQEHALDAGVYIRSLGSRGDLGGLSAAAPEVIRTVAACGFPLVLVETVGVGQAEVDIASTADTTVVVLNPDYGDAIQASKAGLLEVADVFVVNKADRPGAEQTRRDLLEHTLARDDMSEDDWLPPIVLTSAASGEGVDEVLGAVGDHRAFLERTGGLEERRAARALGELRHLVVRGLEARARAAVGDAAWRQLADDVAARRVDPVTAAERIIAAT